MRRWDDQVDIPPTEAIERVIRNATGLETHTSELIAPRQRRSPLLEHADRLSPAICEHILINGRYLIDPDRVAAGRSQTFASAAMPTYH